MELLCNLAAAFATAMLAGMGVGGGGLLVLYLAFFSALSQQEAQGVNLLCFLCSAGAGLAVHLKKRKLRFPVLALFAGAALLTAIPGSILAGKIASSLLRRLFGALMAAGGLWSLFSGKESRHRRR